MSISSGTSNISDAGIIGCEDKSHAEQEDNSRSGLQKGNTLSLLQTSPLIWSLVLPYLPLHLLSVYASTCHAAAIAARSDAFWYVRTASHPAPHM
jgi:hypothetical protein